MDQNKSSDEEVSSSSYRVFYANTPDPEFVSLGNIFDGSGEVKDDVAQDALADRRVEAEQSLDSLSTVDENAILNTNDENFENRLRQQVDIFALAIHRQEDASTDRRVVVRNFDRSPHVDDIVASDNVDAEIDRLYAYLLSDEIIDDDDDELNQFVADLEEELDIAERQPRPPRRPKRPALTLEEIQPHENKRLSDASEILGVHASTLSKRRKELTGTKWPGPRGLISDAVPRSSRQSLRPSLREFMISLNTEVQNLTINLVDGDEKILQMQDATWSMVSRVANIVKNCCPREVTKANYPSSFKEFYKPKNSECWLSVLPEYQRAEQWWWDSLLGKPNTFVPAGWLTGQHINAWSRLMISLRLSEADWTIAPTELLGHQNQEPNLNRISKLAGTLDGTQEPFIAWALVNRVFIPINVRGEHWVLGILDLNNRTISVYDTLKSDDNEAWIANEVKNWYPVLRSHLGRIGYFDITGTDSSSFELTIEYADRVPQQKNVSDCGVLVCMFLKQFCLGQAIQDDSGIVTEVFRDEMAERFYNTRVERPSKRKRNLSTCRNQEENQVISDSKGEPIKLRVLEFEVTPDFWRVLDGGSSEVGAELGTGYLEAMHIDAWSSLLMENRPENADWTIMPSEFLTTLDEETDLKYGAGGHPYPSWSNVNHIILPISINLGTSGHWSMGVLDLRNGTIDVYDSLPRGRHDHVTTGVLQQFIPRLRQYLQHIGYTQAPPEEFNIRVLEDTPIQSGLVGDCGVWVCIHMECFTEGRRVECESTTDRYARDYRRYMAKKLYETREEAEQS